MFTEDELKNLSKLVFLYLIDKVKGHVFTKAHPDEDSLYINIKKGSLDFECGIFNLSDYAKNYSKVDFEDMASAIGRKVITYYKIDIMDRYLKNQPTLSLRRNAEKGMIANVKEELMYDELSVRSGTDQSSSVSI